MSVKCFLTLHKYKQVHRITNTYRTHQTWDTRGDCGTDYHNLYFEECQVCGTRRLVVIGGKRSDINKHTGVQTRKYEWEVYGELG